MQTTSEQSTPAFTKIIAFLLYLIGGLLIFLWGANTFRLFPTNRNLVYEWGLTALLLLLAVVMHKVPGLQIYWKIASALFIAAAANAINLSLGNFLAPILHLQEEDMRFLAIDKLSQAIPIVLTIILLTLWSGDDLGSLFLKKGDLYLGLRFGLISFAIFVVIFTVIVIFQAKGPASQGLFASGINPTTIISSIPWILMFCFVNSFMEELWFRGVSLNKLTPLLGWVPSIIVTAMVFGVSHLAATYITPVQMLLFSTIVIGLGLVNAYMMLKTDSIWGSVLFHAGYDLLVIIPILASL
jgi:membrane protease YdiL (CAAX protease family)